MICNALSKDDNELIAKLLSSVELFSRKNMTIICRFFDYDKDMFAKEMKTKFGENITIIFTRRKLFSKETLSKMQITLSEESLNEVIASAIKNSASPEIEGRNIQGATLFEIGLNDNDGTFINFNTNEFCFNHIKEKVNQIFE